MSLWDVIYKCKLRQTGIHIDLYTIYVDDQLDVCPPITPGWAYNPKNKRMEYSEERARSDTDPPAIRTAKILQEIANTIEGGIKVTYDTPENNISGKLPVLDLEVWVHDNVISHSFYKKSVSSEFTILKRSALSESTKTNTTFIECLRRIGNCSQDIPWSIVSQYVSQYMNSMRISGYSQEERYNTARGAVLRYRELKEQARTGQRECYYRSGENIRRKKDESKNWSNTWFLKGNIKNTVSCPVTPGGILKKNLLR